MRSIEGSILLTGTRLIPALAAEATDTGTVTVTVPSKITDGAYYLLACADDTHIVRERGEDNNCIATSTTVQIAH